MDIYVVYIYIYICYIDAHVYVYILLSNKKKWAFCLRCAQVDAHKRNLKLPFKFQPYLHSAPSRRGPFSCLSSSVQAWGQQLLQKCWAVQNRHLGWGNAVALPFVLNNPDFAGLKGKMWLWLLLAGQAGPWVRGELALLISSDWVMQKQLAC